MKFKYKTILGILLIEVLLVSVLIGVAESKLTDITLKMAKNHSEATLKAIVAASKEYFLTEDVAKLTELAESAVNDGVVEYIVLYDMEGEEWVRLGKIPSSLPVLGGLNGSSYTIFSDIEESEFKIGRVNLGVSFSNVNQFINEFKSDLPLIGAIGLALSAIFSWLLGSTLSNRLGELERVTGQISSTDKEYSNVAIREYGSDEISSVIRSFNLMSERVNKQYQLISSTKALYENIFNGSNDVLILIDSDANIIQANNKFYELFPHAIDGSKYLLDYFKEASLQEFFDKSCSDRGYELASAHNASGNIRLDMSILDIFDDDNTEVRGTLIRCADVTEQYDLIEKAEMSESIAIDSIKQKEAFFANMSHEIRTPLNGVIGIINILQSLEMTATQREYLRVASTSSNILLAIINDILDFSKIEAGRLELDFQESCFYEELQGIVNAHINTAKEKGIELIVEYNKDEMPYKLLLDNVRVSQIIHNLLSNSIKFTEKGSVILHVSYDYSSEILTLVVRDTGIGMKQSSVDKLFTPFKQADSGIARKFGGTGLGTTIVKQLVALMQGEISVSSVYGCGTTFTVSLPFKLIEKNTPEGYFEEKNHEYDNTSTQQQYGLNVLLVEDNEINQIVAKGVLEILGCTTTIANNGVEGLLSLKGQSFDLVLMDMQMPVLDGISATTQWSAYLRENIDNTVENRETPIVAMTANTSEKDRNDCIKAGMVDFLTKPFELEDIVSMFVKWCGVTQETSISSLAGDKQQLLSKEEKLLDEDRIKNMASQFGGKYSGVYNQFVDNSSKLIGEFNSFIDSDDLSAALKAIHSLKGTSGTMGFNMLFKYCQLVEENVLKFRGGEEKLDNLLIEKLLLIYEQSIKESKKFNF